MRINTYFTVWKMTALNAVQEAFVNRASNSLFFAGKMIRFAMSLLFLMMIKQSSNALGSYTTDQMIVFYLTYQFVDTLAQIVYRGTYMFGNMVRTGEFDFFLSKPINPLFRALTGKPDINDVVFFFPSTLLSLYIVLNLNLHITLQSLTIYFILLINSFLIATALHILVLTVGVMTTEVDGIVWMYRDLMSLGQIPVSIYQEPLRSILFFVIPVGMMITIPSEILFSSDPTYSLLLTALVGIGSVLASLLLWNAGVKQYSSASS